MYVSIYNISSCVHSYKCIICVLQEENDVNYEAEAEVADEFDSDFDEDVSFLLLVEIFNAIQFPICHV